MSNDWSECPQTACNSQMRCCYTEACESRLRRTDTPESPSKEQESLRDKILAERDKGNLVYAHLEGYSVVKVEDFVKQPAEGMLYDLNRGEEVSLSFITEKKWVNDFAVALTIRKLVEQRDAARSEIAPNGSTVFECHDCHAKIVTLVPAVCGGGGSGRGMVASIETRGGGGAAPHSPQGASGAPVCVAVPQEPTNGMMIAGAEANVAHDNGAYEKDGMRRSMRVYKAMIAAAQSERPGE